jgi:hypothetical protein
MAFNYNDIRNQNWYDRLISNVKSGTSAKALQSGAEPDDAYLKAVEDEQLGDLKSARGDAFRNAQVGNMNSMASSMYNKRMREQARQRAITAALKDQWQPDVNLGTGKGAGGAGIGGVAGNTDNNFDIPNYEANLTSMQSPKYRNRSKNKPKAKNISGDFGGKVKTIYKPEQFKSKIKKPKFGLSGY